MTMEKFAAQAKAERPENADRMIESKKKEIDKRLESLDWDLWLGTAPKREFWPGLYHTFAWRGWWDFGSGALGDMACHQVTVPFDGCGLRDPISVKAKTSGHDFDSFPASSVIEFQFPENAERPPLKFWWYDRKGNKPPMEVFDAWEIKPADSGVLIIGEKGAFYSADDYCGTAEFKKCQPLPDDQLTVEYAEKKGGNDLDNMFELFRAVNAKDPTICKSSFVARGGPLTETILLGNLAVWAAYQGGPDGALMADWGPTIEWDAKDLVVKNLDAIRQAEGSELADRILGLIKPTYAEGYRLD